MNDMVPELKKRTEKSKEELQKMNDSLQKYTSIFQKREGAFKDPNASTETLIRLNRETAEALTSVPAAYRAQVASAVTLADAQEAMAEAMMMKTREVQQQDFHYNWQRGWMTLTGFWVTHWGSLDRLRLLGIF